MARYLLDPGETFARDYVVERLLGEGERKRAYLARDQHLRRDVALVLVKPDSVSKDPEATAREVERLAQVGPHAHVVTLHHAGTEAGIEYLVFEHMPGGDLEQHCRRIWEADEHLTLDEVLRYGRQLCRALSHMHSKGIVHLDLAPGNVWLDEYGAAHLGDFDMAARLDEPFSRNKASTSSEAYVIPEIARGEAPDQRNDLFSLGALLFEISTGQRPGIAAGVRGADLVRPSTIRQDLPSSFDDLVRKLLSESPDDRPPTAGVVLRSLREIAETSNVEAMIAGGESDRVEFKGSLRYPLGPPPDQVEQATWLRKMQLELEKGVAKTIASFLNTSGGTLLIGVADNGTVVGIERDFPSLKTPNSDRWLLALKDAVQRHLGEDIWGSVRVSLVRRDRGTVAVATCAPRTRETWLTIGGMEEFYVRTSASAQALSPSKAANYIREHWPKLT